VDRVTSPRRPTLHGRIQQATGVDRRAPPDGHGAIAVQARCLLFFRRGCQPYPTDLMVMDSTWRSSGNDGWTLAMTAGSDLHVASGSGCGP
jgi:hypothetical protein